MSFQSGGLSVTVHVFVDVCEIKEWILWLFKAFSGTQK